MAQRSGHIQEQAAKVLLYFGVSFFVIGIPVLITGAVLAGTGSPE